eukprot:scaffold102254_cov48-Phaeocystis_antarctica.AAC.1
MNHPRVVSAWKVLAAWPSPRAVLSWISLMRACAFVLRSAGPTRARRAPPRPRARCSSSARTSGAKPPVLWRVTDYVGRRPCGTEPEAAFLQLPAAAFCFAALVAATFAIFVATAALLATTGSSAVAVAAIAPATVASAWSRRLCLVLVLLQASRVQAEVVSGYNGPNVNKGCNARNELWTRTKTTVQECAATCTADATCVSFEIGASAGGGAPYLCRGSSSCTAAIITTVAN